jgi:hypothetical protein
LAHVETSIEKFIHQKMNILHESTHAAELVAQTLNETHEKSRKLCVSFAAGHT